MKDIFDELTIDSDIFAEIKYALNNAIKKAAEKINENNKVKITLAMELSEDELKTYEVAPGEKLLNSVLFNVKTDVTEKAYGEKGLTEQIAISKDGQGFLARKADMQLEFNEYVEEGY